MTLWMSSDRFGRQPCIPARFFVWTFVILLYPNHSFAIWVSAKRCLCCLFWCKLHFICEHIIDVESSPSCLLFYLFLDVIMHLSSASPRGEGEPRLMWGLCELRISKFLNFLQSPQYLAKPSTQPDLKMHFRTLFWFFEQLANTRTLDSDENWTLIIFFLEYYISCSQSDENFNFSPRPEFPRFCCKSIRTDEEQGKTHYHDGSWPSTVTSINSNIYTGEF